MPNVDFKTLIDMFNSQDPNNVNLAEGIFLNFTDDEVTELWNWGFEHGYAKPYLPVPKINEKFWNIKPKNK